MRYPNITLCPKNADAINLTLVLADIDERLSGTIDLNGTDTQNLIAFALGGAGFDNFDKYVKVWNADYIKKLSIWFQKWQGDRELMDFYHFLFEEAGFQCEDVRISFLFSQIIKNRKSLRHVKNKIHS